MRSVPVGIGWIRNRVFQWVNEYFLCIVGYPEHELLGRSARVLYESEEEFERIGRVKYGQIARRGHGEIETRFRRKDGLLVDCLLYTSDAADECCGVLFAGVGGSL